MGRDILKALSLYSDPTFASSLQEAASIFTSTFQKSLSIYPPPCTSSILSYLCLPSPHLSIFLKVASTLTSQRPPSPNAISSDSESDDNSTNLINHNLHSFKKSLQKSKKPPKIVRKISTFTQRYVHPTRAQFFNKNYKISLYSFLVDSLSFYANRFNLPFV
jgi:hypothetical protein